MTTAGIYDFSFSISIHTVYVVSHTERQTYTQNHTEYVRCDFEFSVLLFFGFNIFDAAGLSNFHGDVWWYNVVMVEGHCHTGTPLSH